MKFGWRELNHTVTFRRESYARDHENRLRTRTLISDSVE